jgi:tetratricopeptide (TPR) repeat protein
VSSAQTEGGDAGANKGLDEALILAEAVESPRERAGLLCDIASRFAQRGDERSGLIFSKALNAADAIAEPKARAEELIRLGWTLSHAGDSRANVAFKEAHAAIAAIEGTFELSMKGGTLCYLVSALSLTGRFAEASKIAYAIEDEAWRASALRELGAALAGQNNLEEADRVFDEVERQLQSIQNHLSWESVAHDLVVSLANAGRYLKVLDFLKSVDLDTFLEVVLSIIPGLERLNRGVTLNLVREVSGVAGWLRPRWRRVHELLSAARTLD